MRKRDKDRQRRDADSEWHLVSRTKKRPSARKQSLRKPQVASVLQHAHVGPQDHSGGSRGPLWTPKAARAKAARDRAKPFVQTRWTSLCGEMAGRDGPALAVRSPRAHSPLQHGAREPDADHTSDRPPCVAGSRPSMRSAVRAHAHRSRSSRTLRRAQLGRLLVVGAQRRKKACALHATSTPPHRAHKPDPPRGTPSAQPSVRAAAAPANLCFLTGASR